MKTKKMSLQKIGYIVFSAFLLVYAMVLGVFSGNVPVIGNIAMYTKEIAFENSQFLNWFLHLLPQSLVLPTISRIWDLPMIGIILFAFMRLFRYIRRKKLDILGNDDGTFGGFFCGVLFAAFLSIGIGIEYHTLAAAIVLGDVFSVMVGFLLGVMSNTIISRWWFSAYLLFWTLVACVIAGVYVGVVMFILLLIPMLITYVIGIGLRLMFPKQKKRKTAAEAAMPMKESTKNYLWIIGLWLAFSLLFIPWIHYAAEERDPASWLALGVILGFATLVMAIKISEEYKRAKIS